MKKRRYIIVTMLMVFAICCCMISGCNQTTTNNGQNEQTNTAIAITDNTQNYGYTIPEDFSIESEDSKEETIKDAVKLFKTNPSLDVPSDIKEKEIDERMEKTISIITNPEKYKTCLLTEEEIEEMKTKSEIEDGSVVTGITAKGKTQEYDVGLKDFGYTQTNKIQNDGCYEINTQTENKVCCGIDCKNFKDRQNYYNVSYMLLRELLDNLSDKELSESISPMQANITLDTIFQAAEDRNYDVLFDAIMNGVIAISYQAENGMFVHMECEKDISYVLENKEVVTTEAVYCYQTYTF